MKKFALLTTLTSYALMATSVLAQAEKKVPLTIIPPKGGIPPATNIGTIISNALTIVFIVAALAVLFMLVIGAFQWITSGGDKEAVGKARGRIVAALVGLAVLALAFLIVQVVGSVLNINIINISGLPTLDSNPNIDTGIDQLPDQIQVTP